MEALFSTSAPFVVPSEVDFFSIIVGVVTGALCGCGRKLDIVGCIVAGLLTAYGGGIIRDLLLQDEGIYFMDNPGVVLICIALAAFVFYFRGWFARLDRSLFVLDAFSVALFALAGANKAFQCGEGVVMVVLLGAITSVGGGALRDVCTGVVPSVFRSSNYYAVAGVAGSVAFAALAFAGVPLIVAAVACVAVVVALRCLSVRYGWTTAAEADYYPYVSRGARKVRDAAKGLIDRHRPS